MRFFRPMYGVAYFDAPAEFYYKCALCSDLEFFSALKGASGGPKEVHPIKVDGIGGWRGPSTVPKGSPSGPEGWFELTMH